MVRKIFIKIKDFLKIPKFQESRNPSWLHYGYIMATFDNLAKKQNKNIQSKYTNEYKT